MKHRLIVILASVTLASSFSYQASAQEFDEPEVFSERGEKGGVNLNRFRDDLGDPVGLMDTTENDIDEEIGVDTSGDDADTYQLYDPDKSDLGPEAYRMDPSMRD